MGEGLVHVVHAHGANRVPRPEKRDPTRTVTVLAQGRRFFASGRRPSGSPPPRVIRQDTDSPDSDSTPPAACFPCPYPATRYRAATRRAPGS